jgi:hypothetical protein
MQPANLYQSIDGARTRAQSRAPVRATIPPRHAGRDSLHWADTRWCCSGRGGRLADASADHERLVAFSPRRGSSEGLTWKIGERRRGRCTGGVRKATRRPAGGKRRALSPHPAPPASAELPRRERIAPGGDGGRRTSRGRACGGTADRWRANFGRSFFTEQKRTHRVLPARPSRPRAFRKFLPTGSLGPDLGYDGLSNSGEAGADGAAKRSHE